jgi:endonuclease YncB( thermonuclease family)
MAGRSPLFSIAAAGFFILSGGAPGAAEENNLWPQTPVRIDRSKQHYERLPAVQVAIDRRTWFIVPPRIMVLDSARFSADGKIYHISDIRPVQPKRLCDSIGGGKWGCGRLAAILLGNLVRGRKLLCTVVPGEKETVLERCGSGNKDVAAEILTKGFGHVGEGSPLAAFQAEGQKTGAGLWRNPDCKLDFDHC